MAKTVEQILPAKPAVKPRIYAYTINASSHEGLLKIGQTTRDVRQRVLEQVKTVAIDFNIEVDEPAFRNDGTVITDHEVRSVLKKKGFENPQLEWMRCTVPDVKRALTELRIGKRLSKNRMESFPPRREQAEAVQKTYEYFNAIWN